MEFTAKYNTHKYNQNNSQNNRTKGLKKNYIHYNHIAFTVIIYYTHEIRSKQQQHIRRNKLFDFPSKLFFGRTSYAVRQYCNTNWIYLNMYKIIICIEGDWQWWPNQIPRQKRTIPIMQITKFRDKKTIRTI